MKEKQHRRTYFGFMILMIALGASDAVRGVFTPIFSEHFSLSAAQLSTIVTAGYLGNLVFLMFGGRVVDKLDRRVSFLGLTVLWMLALAMYCLTDSYAVLVFGAFLSLGCSTLINTTMNLYTTILFAASPGMAVNFLYFIQGIGTSGGQSLAGNLATGFVSWKITNLLLIGIGVIALLILFRAPLPEQPKEQGGKTGGGFRTIAATPAFWMMILIFAFYFVAEHGIANWLVAYANMELGIPMGTAANYVAVFSVGIMVGRLVFSPMVDRLGVFKSMCLCATAAAILFVIGSVSGGRMLWVLSASGLFFSIIYPTLVMSISKFYAPAVLSSASGMIISVASLGDILFNAVFGSIVDMIGYGKAFLILPAAMVIFTVLLWVFSIWSRKHAK